MGKFRRALDGDLKGWKGHPELQGFRFTTGTSFCLSWNLLGEVLKALRWSAGWTGLLCVYLHLPCSGR